MSLKILRPGFWPFTPRGEAAVTRDADELIGTWGSAAPSVADSLSWREDVGLIHTARPGHWSRVRQEIDRRVETPGATPELDRAA